MSARETSLGDSPECRRSARTVARVSLLFNTALVVLVSCIAGAQALHAQETWTTLPSISKTQDTTDKPQSKAWFHAHTWWTVLATDAPVPGGTWLLRLERDNTWSPVLQLSSNAGSKADVKAVGDVAHILLNNSTPELVSVQYDPASNTYQPWSERPTHTPVVIGDETGTIDIDSTGRMWLATDTLTGIDVYYSDYPYASFSGPVTVATGITVDDIGAVTALPNHTIGVFWSNRNAQRFGFSVHEDGADPTVWLADEVPASQSAIADGAGMADDHMNLAVAPDGTLYVAVKTRYSNPSLPKVALLVRHPDANDSSGTWDDLHPVDIIGTRPIVLLNDDTLTIRVFYSDDSGNVFFKESPADHINFGPAQQVMSGGFNDVTSTKDAWAGRLLILASDAVGVTGVVMTTDPGLVGHWKMDEGGGSQLRDMSGWGNDADVVGSPAWVKGFQGSALALDGSSHAVVSDQAGLDVSTGLTLSAWIQPSAQTDQDLISRAVTNSVDGYTLGLSSSSSATAPGTVFLRLNQATSGSAFQLSSVSQYPATGLAWMHVAATYDGTTMRMYINGVEESSIPGPVSIATNAVDFGIGAQSDGANPFHGVFDDVRVYNRALSASEIAAFSAQGPPTTDLSITTDDHVSSIGLGQPVSYTIVATNLGPSDVVGAKVSDVIPPELGGATWTCVPSGGTCSAGGSGDLNDVVSLPVGASVTYTVNATVASTAVGFIHNTATIGTSAATDPAPGNNSSTDTDVIPIVFEAHFDTGSDGFVYADDVFRGTSQPTYASGAYLASGGFSGGGLQVNVGGINSHDIQGMSGGWQRTFTLTNPTPLTLSFRSQLTETPNYESDEFNQVLVSVDGVLYGVTPHDYVAQVTGGGLGPTTTGWQQTQVNFGTLSAGTHTLTIGDYNNQKTYFDESAEVLIDDVLLGVGTGPVPATVVTPPSDVSVTAPAPATFSVAAVGDAPLSYQWRWNGVPIPGATNATYVLDPTSVADSGAQFDVVVTNAFGSATSTPATLTVSWGGGGSDILIDSHFDTGVADFTYVDDTFRGTSQPSYASGAYLASGGFTGGALQVAVGGVNSQDIQNMSGGWQHSFTLAGATHVSLSFRVNLTETPNYESDEFSQALVGVDGVLYGVPPNDYVAQVVGGGNGPETTGWQLVQIDFGTLSAGTHTLTLGGYNNQKTYFDESAEVLIDDVLLTAASTASVPPSITTPPSDVAVNEPNPAGFTVVAAGDAPLSYRWRRNGVDIPGATSATYVLDPTALADNGARFDVLVTNGAGSATSAPATLTVNPAPVPPSIATQPVSVTVTAPAAASFSVVASGDAPLSYQWRRNGVDIPGATSATYGLAPTSVGDSGAAFDVVVTNAGGSVTSTAAALTVNPAPVPPSITTQPVDVVVTEPTLASFAVVATGDAPLTYQWRRGGVDIPGATGTSYLVDPTSVSDSGATFDVVVTNGAGTATSLAAILTVNPPPVAPGISTQPASLTVTEPAPAGFAVVATGDAPLTYQWRRGGVDIPGATAASYVLDPTAVADSGAAFDVVVTNGVGTATSTQAILTVNPAPVPPAVTTSPTSIAVTEPASASFTVVATGDAPLSYQWRRNGTAIPGATSATYVLSPTGVGDSGASFDVVVSNGAGSATSAAAVLTVNPAPVPPSITTGPASAIVTEPGPASFAVVATGDAPLSYQWRRNGVDIPGATSATYVLDPTSVSDTGAQFDVVVTNGVGTATSSAATLTVAIGSGGGSANTTLTSPTSPIPFTGDYNDNLLGSEYAVAVWAAPDPNNSLLFVTQKSLNVVQVWNLQTNQIVQTLTGFNKPLGVAVDPVEGAVYVTSQGGAAVYKYLIADIVGGNLSPALTFGQGMSPSAQPSGITVSHGGGTTRVYVVYTGSSTKFVRGFDTNGTLQSSWSLGSLGVNEIAADDENNLLYVADQTNNLIKVYRPDGTFVQDFGQADFAVGSDVEGIAVYRCGSSGYIVASDQSTNEFEIFDRTTFAHLATFTVQNARNTIGVALTQAPLPGYPNGAFFVQSREKEVFGVPWDAIAGATGASICAAK